MREGAVETHDLILTHPQTHYRLTTDRQRQRQALEARNWFFFFFFSIKYLRFLCDVQSGLLCTVQYSLVLYTACYAHLRSFFLIHYRTPLPPSTKKKKPKARKHLSYKRTKLTIQPKQPNLIPPPFFFLAALLAIS
jgi:hypothetical protein